MGTRARFRQEERLRADLRRERRLRQQAITERVNAMKANIAKDLATQHELTLDALENELRGTMEAELETMEQDTLWLKKHAFDTNLTSDLTGKSNRSTRSTVLNSISALKSERLNENQH